MSAIARLVEAGAQSKSLYVRLADRAASIYVPVVHTAAALTLAVGWALGLEPREALLRAVAVLIITCPCALGLAVPAVVTAASGKLFRAGLLIKSGTALERLAEVDTVVFDKTGTLTLGFPQPTNTKTLSPEQRALIAALAAGSSHPLAQGLRNLADPAALDDLTEVAGQGISARWNGQQVRLGRAEWVGAALGQQTATWLRVADDPPVEITFTDQLRPGAKVLVQGLLDQGYDVHLVSGDVPAVVQDMAERLNIPHWQAQVLPAQKAEFVTGLAQKGRRVLMVGDGLNDTGALAAASVSISPASALDAARVASDIVLMGRDIAPIAAALRIAKQARRRITENFAISGLYNIVAVPLAMVGLPTPLLAALAMSLIEGHCNTADLAKFLDKTNKLGTSHTNEY